MKITKIRIDCLSVPLRHPYRLCREYGVLPATTPVIVSVFTDEGVTGYGECDPWPRFTGDSAEICALTLEKHIAPAVIGLDSTNINAIHANAIRSIWPHTLPVQFNTSSFKLVRITHSKTPFPGCPGKGVHIIGRPFLDRTDRADLWRQSDGRFRSVYGSCGSRGDSRDRFRSIQG